jgi:hypothetical protein
MDQHAFFPGRKDAAFSAVVPELGRNIYAGTEKAFDVMGRPVLNVCGIGKALFLSIDPDGDSKPRKTAETVRDNGNLIFLPDDPTDGIAVTENGKRPVIAQDPENKERVICFFPQYFFSIACRFVNEGHKRSVFSGKNRIVDAFPDHDAFHFFTPS